MERQKTFQTIEKPNNTEEQSWSTHTTWFEDFTISPW